MQLTFLVSFLMFLTLALSLVVPSGYSIGVVLLLLLFVVSYPFVFRQYALGKEDKLLIAFLFVYACCMFGYVLYDSIVPRNFERPSRYLLIVPVLLLLLKMPLRKEYIFYGIVVGAIGGVCLSLYQKIILGVERASGSTHVVKYGDVSMLLGLLSVAAFILYFHRKNGLFLCLALLGVVSGVLSSVLSGTRGSWIVLPVILIFISWKAFTLFGLKKVLTVFLTCLFLAVFAFFIPQTGVSTRLSHAVSNVQGYVEGEKVSSLGHRFEMWKAAWYMFQEAPILGVGKSNFRPRKRDYAEQGLIHPSVVEIYGHSHNDYLHALAVRGIIGLILLMLLYLLPLWLFWRKLSAYPDEWSIRSYAIAGAIVPLSYMGFGLSDCLFMSNITIVLYLSCIAFFWAATRWAEREYLGQVNAFS